MCLLYGGKDGNAINELCYKLLCSGTADSSHLPPTQDELHLHIAHCTCKLSGCCMEMIFGTGIDAPSPNGHGWKITGTGEGRTTEVDWMQQQPAPSAVLEPLSCGCSGNYSTRQCSCVCHGLMCTDLCHCSEACKNSISGQDVKQEQDNSEHDD